MEQSSSNQVVLKNRTLVDIRAKRFGLWFVVITGITLLVVTAIVLYFVVTKAGKPLDWEMLADRLMKKMREDWVDLVILSVGLVIAVLQVVYLALARGRERLILNETGVQYVSPLPESLQFLRPSWSLQWSHIRRCTFKKMSFGLRPELVTLVFDTGRRQRKIRPYLWVDPNTHVPSSSDWRKEFTFKKINSLEVTTAIMQSLLMRYLDSLPRISFTLPNLEFHRPFALEKNPTAIIFVVIFFLALFYALLDGFVTNPEVYAERPMYEVYFGVGLIFTIIVFTLMHRMEVPLMESVFVALLTGSAFGAALHPGLLRINQFTDTGGLHEFEYRMVRLLEFRPVDEALPLLRLPAYQAPYWEQFGVDSTHTFKLRKGGLQFYQLHMRSIIDCVREFNIDNRNGTDFQRSIRHPGRCR